MNVKHLLLIGGSAAFLFAACNQSTSTTVETSATPEATADVSAVPSMAPSSSPTTMVVPSTKTIALSEQNQSGETGTAVLTSTKDGKVNVVLTLKGGKFTTPQP